ncbi:MAG TPA: MFS transporter [Polyangiaceae bacterium]|nr:MFS transporter [Polyangiaceae bacterium]
MFLAVCGPMSTVPALRRLLIDVHGGGPALLQWFVVVGMLGAVLGAPVLARFADARDNHLQLASRLALLDALLALLTSGPVSTTIVFLLRPIHGAASMGILALILARFRGSRRELVSQAGGAAIAALAFGPALGGALTQHGAATPFRFAALLSVLLAGLLALHKGASVTAAPVMPARPKPQLAVLARTIGAPMLLIASQRFAIGGLVAALAVHLRAKHGFTDARVGACFSILLVAFALGTWWSGKTHATTRSVARIVPGAALFAGAFAAVGFAPALALMAALALAGLGAALVYAPCLALVAERAPTGTRATAMALLQAAGSVGMVLGPLGALLVGYALRGVAPEREAAAFMSLAGALHVATALCLVPHLRRWAGSAAPIAPGRSNLRVATPASPHA